MAKRPRNASFSVPFSSSQDSLAFSPKQAEKFSPQEPVSKKQGQVDHTQDSTATPPMFQCSLPPHRETIRFQSHQELEVHYQKVHTNRCSSCNGNFPTEHYLQLHIEEIHDPLREILQARGEKTYRCLVEDCEKMCSTPQKRRLHCIDKHAFPRTYNFDVLKDGIDQHNSMLLENRRRRRISSVTERSRHRTTNTEGIVDRALTDLTAEEGSPRNSNSVKTSAPSPEAPKPSHTTPASQDKAVQELEKSMSALQFVPRNVTVKRNDR